MPAITICPLCRKSLVVPEGLDRETRVRCPLCTSEYPLAMVLADVVDVLMPAHGDDAAASPVALPPEFVPVAHVELRSAAAGEPEPNEPEPDDVLADDVLADDVLADDVPAEDVKAADAEAADLVVAVFADEQPVAEAESPTAAAEHAPLAESPADDDGFTWVPTAEAPADDDGFTLGHPDHASPGDEAPHDVSHLDFIPGVGAGGESGPPVSRALSDWRAQQQKSRPSHVLAKFFGVAIAGVLGVSLAYLAMSWANPAKFDFLHIWGPSKTAAPSGGGSQTPSPIQPTEADEAKWR